MICCCRAGYVINIISALRINEIGRGDFLSTTTTLLYVVCVAEHISHVSHTFFAFKEGRARQCQRGVIRGAL